MKRVLFTVFLLLTCLPAFAQRFVDDVPNIAALKSRLTGNLNRSVFVRGYFTEGDGGGGLFIITNSNILVDNIFRIQSTSNPAWSYDRQFSGPVDLRWGGAVGDGSAGDNTKIAAVVNAAAAKGYGALISNLTGSNGTNQFQLSLIPTLKANQKYLQVGSIGGLSVYTEASSNFVFLAKGQNIFDRGLMVGTNTRANLGILSGETTNGLMFTAIFNKAIGDPSRAYTLFQVNKDTANMNERSSYQQFVNSTNAYVELMTVDTNAVGNVIQLNAATNTAGILIYQGTVLDKNAYIGVGPGPITSAFSGPQLIISGTNQIAYNDDTAKLYIQRTTYTGTPLLDLTDGGGVSPILRLYGNGMDTPNTAMALGSQSGINMTVSGVNGLRLTAGISIIVGDGATTTTRSNRFLYIPTTAGLPTGVPAVEQAGTVPIDWDSSNGNLYIYKSGLGWIRVGGLGNASPNFGSQFTVDNGTNISLAVGLSTTNQNFSGATTAGTINLGSKSGAFVIDAGSAPEFNVLISGNASVTFTNWPDFHNVNLTMTNAGNFSVTFADPMYWIPNGNATQITNDWGAGIINKFAFWKTGGRILASDKEGLAQLSSGSSGANPTALVGLTAVNGASAFFMRSDAAPALDQSISPTWTGDHLWSKSQNGTLTQITLANTDSTAGVNAGVSIPFYLNDDSAVAYRAGLITVGKMIDWLGAGTADAFLSLDVARAGATFPIFGLYGGNAPSYYQSPMTIGTADPFVNLYGFQFRSSETASVGAQKNSPATFWQGSGWNVAGFAINASMGAYVIPVQEASGNPSARWILDGKTTNSPNGTPLFEVTSKSSIILGERVALQTNATDGFTYLPSGAGIPLGTPVSVTGKVPFYYDSANAVLYIYSGGAWKAFTQSAAGANWVALGTTNSQLFGYAYLDRVVATNGMIVGSAFYNASTVSLVNAGGVSKVVNNSSAAGTSLTLQAGTGPESFLTFNSGNAIRGYFLTNGALQTLSGRVIQRFATATNYTLTATNHYVVATATLTNTLPAANTFQSGRLFIIKSSAAGVTVTVRPTGGDTIDGVGGDDTLSAKVSRTYISDGSSNWEVN